MVTELITQANIALAGVDMFALERTSHKLINGVRLAAMGLRLVGMVLGEVASIEPIANALDLTNSLDHACPGGIPVHYGDTLTSLAKGYHTTVPALIEANNIADPDAIQAGTCLAHPGMSSIPSNPAIIATPNPELYPAVCGGVYVAKEIDHNLPLGAVTAHMDADGVSLPQLQACNEGVTAYTIVHTGDEFVLPGNGAGDSFTQNDFTGESNQASETTITDSAPPIDAGKAAQWVTGIIVVGGLLALLSRVAPSLMRSRSRSKKK